MSPRERDEAWQAAQDAAAVEASHEDVSFEGSDPAWDLESEFYGALEREATEPAAPVDTAVDDRLIAAAIADAAVVAPAPAASGRGVWLGVVAAAAAAVALVVLWPRGVFEVSRGTWVDESGAAFAAGDSLAAGEWLVAGDDACVSRTDGELCAEAGSKLRLRDREAAAELAEGGVWVENGRWSVLAAGAEQILSSGDTFRLHGAAVAQASRTHTVASKPSAEMPAPIEKTPTLSGVQAEASSAAASSATTSSATTSSAAPTLRPRAAPQSAATLLARARTQLGEGKPRAADKTYAQLLRAHPKSAEAGVGRVALGQLRLKRGRARSALGLFDAYLRGKGPLGEEAAWGRIQALKALGKRDALDAAVTAFLTDHPRSVYRKRAQQSVVR